MVWSLMAGGIDRIRSVLAVSPEAGTIELIRIKNASIRAGSGKKVFTLNLTVLGN